MNAQTLVNQNRALRAEIISSLEYSIRGLKSLLDAAKKGETIYPSAFQGSAMTGLPGKIEVLRTQERIASEMKATEVLV